ncbi:hypothetical protein BU17DRAFT_71021 [Hysterangium stoloniferum]|nr:hypothetical protein BU17DRAFT_71021 [Hysterangium stoloniferum]
MVFAAHYSMSKTSYDRDLEGDLDLPKSLRTLHTLSVGERHEHQQQVGTSANLKLVSATRGTKSSESTPPSLPRIRRRRPRIFFFADESDIDDTPLALPFRRREASVSRDHIDRLPKMVIYDPLQPVRSKNKRALVSHGLPKTIVTPPSLEDIPHLVKTGDQLPWPPLARRVPTHFQYPIGLGRARGDSNSDGSGDNMLIKEDVAFPSGSGCQMRASSSTGPVMSPSRIIPTAHSTEDHRDNILELHKSLNLVLSKDGAGFNLHVKLADWKEICTGLLNMSGTCGNYYPNSISIYDGEMKNATPRQPLNTDHMEHPEGNIAPVVPLGKSTKGEELDALSSNDLPLTAQSPSSSLPPTSSHTVWSDTLSNFQPPDPTCLPMIQTDLARRRCSYRYNSPQDLMEHWLKGHLFELWEGGSVDLSGQQWEIVYNSLLRCQEEACPKRGGFFFSENFEQHCKDHKKGLAPGDVLDGIEKREADQLCAMRTLLSKDVSSYMSWEDKFICSIF